MPGINKNFDAVLYINPDGRPKAHDCLFTEYAKADGNRFRVRAGYYLYSHEYFLAKAGVSKKRWYAIPIHKINEAGFVIKLESSDTFYLMDKEGGWAEGYLYAFPADSRYVAWDE